MIFSLLLKYLYYILSFCCLIVLTGPFGMMSNKEVVLGHCFVPGLVGHAAGMSLFIRLASKGYSEPMG